VPAGHKWSQPGNGNAFGTLARPGVTQSAIAVWRDVPMAAGGSNRRDHGIFRD